MSSFILTGNLLNVVILLDCSIWQHQRIFILIIFLHHYLATKKFQHMEMIKVCCENKVQWWVFKYIIHACFVSLISTVLVQLSTNKSSGLL